MNNLKIKQETSSDSDKSQSDMEHVSHFVDSLDPEEYTYLKQCCDNRDSMHLSEGISTDTPDAKDQGVDDSGGNVDEDGDLPDKESGKVKSKSKDKMISLQDFENEDDNESEGA